MSGKVDNGAPSYFGYSIAIVFIGGFIGLMFILFSAPFTGGGGIILGLFVWGFSILISCVILPVAERGAKREYVVQNTIVLPEVIPPLTVHHKD